MLSRRLLRVKVAKTLYAHLKSGSDSLKASENNLVQSIDKAYDLYFQMMDLIVEVARYAESRIELAKQKKLPTYEDLNPNRRFVDNKVINLLATSDSVQDEITRRKLSWANYPDTIKGIYNRLVESDLYKSYMEHRRAGVRSGQGCRAEIWPSASAPAGAASVGGGSRPEGCHVAP